MNKLKLDTAIAAVNRLPSTDRRSDLINAGRLLALEKAGREHNEARLRANGMALDFGSVFTRSADYLSAAEKWGDDVLYFCAEKVAGFSSVMPDRSRRDTFCRREHLTNPLYLNALGGILADVVNAVTPAMVSDIMGEMVSVETVPRGKTLEITVNSNAVFQWYDATWTSLRAVPSNQLYASSITLNPTPKACRFTANFYQMTAGGSGVLDLVSAVAEGYASMLMRAFTTALLSAADNELFVPSSLKATGYTDDNWANLMQNVAKANRCKRTNLIAFGDFIALRKVMPSSTTLGPAIMTPMGTRYFRDGYLQTHDGVALYEITPAVTPGTINGSLTSVFPEDMIVVAARASDRYAPMVMGFEEGGDTTVNLTPGDDVMATGRIEGLATTALDIAPVFANKIGIMSDIT